MFQCSTQRLYVVYVFGVFHMEKHWSSNEFKVLKSVKKLRINPYSPGPDSWVGPAPQHQSTAQSKHRRETGGK